MWATAIPCLLIILLADNNRRTAVTAQPPACRVDEFRCGTSECIPRVERCNGVNDCRDRSDEDGCRKFVLNIYFIFSLT